MATLVKKSFTTEMYALKIHVFWSDLKITFVEIKQKSLYHDAL